MAAIQPVGRRFLSKKVADRGVSTENSLLPGSDDGVFLEEGNGHPNSAVMSPLLKNMLGGDVNAFGGIVHDFSDDGGGNALVVQSVQEGHRLGWGGADEQSS